MLRQRYYWRDAFISQGTPGITSNQQKLGEKQETDSPPELPEEINPANN